MQGLWLSDRKFMDFSEQELTTELAMRGGSIIGSWMGLLPDPDPVLKKSGEGLATLEALEADYKVTSCMQTRKLKTLGKKDYAFSPGHLPGEEATPEAVALCEQLQRDLERIDLYNLMSEVLNAPYYGATVAELIWEAGPSHMRLKNIVPKPLDWFAFDNNGTLRFVGDGFHAEGINGLLPIYGKFVTARHFPTYKNPYGLRLLSRCLFPVAFKKGGIEFMMRFAERWGMPWIVGETRPNAQSKEMYEMRDALSGMVSDAVAVIRGGGKVNLIESKGQSGDVHLNIIRHWDDAIAQVLVGQTLTSSIGENGSYAASRTHGDILDDYVDADSTLVKIFFEELAYVYGQVNARGVLTPIFSFEKPEDQAARATMGKDLYSQGVRFKATYFKNRFGLDDDEFEVLPVTPTGIAPSVAFAEKMPARFTPGQQAIEDLIAELLPEGVTSMDAMIATILQAVDKAETPEEVEKYLAQALTAQKDGGLDHSSFQNILETALFAADMTGRYTGRENIE